MIYRARVIDTAADPFVTGPEPALRFEDDGGLLVRDGVIAERGPYSTVRAGHPDEPVTELRDGLLLPGFVDTHVHFPQLRAMGGLGLPLLDWLRRCALPEESRLADRSYAAAVATEFLAALARSGTTSALVFGAHFTGAMDEFFARAEQSDLNITAGLVVSDRLLRDDLHTSPQQAFDGSRVLLERWHGRGRLRYAVTPRFSLSTSPELLEVCAALMGDGIWFTSHVNENLDEVRAVAGLFPESTHYLDTYHRHGLITERSVLAHNVHATEAELDLMAAAGAWAAHCPTSNSALGSGLFPLRRHVAHGVGVALGSDIGAGTGLFIPKEALQAYFMQQLLGADGLALSPVHLLYLATRAGARALGLADRVGDLGVGKDFDAVWLRPAPASPLAINLEHAVGATDLLARVFALSTAADVEQVWAHGRPLSADAVEGR
jgi:guanine deaminase